MNRRSRRCVEEGKGSFDVVVGDVDENGVGSRKSNFRSRKRKLINGSCLFLQGTDEAPAVNGNKNGRNVIPPKLFAGVFTGINPHPKVRSLNICSDRFAVDFLTIHHQVASGILGCLFERGMQ